MYLALLIASTLFFSKGVYSDVLGLVLREEYQSKRKNAETVKQSHEHEVVSACLKLLKALTR